MKKCGLYLRVSTEEQAEVKEGSLKTQMNRLKTLVKSKDNTNEKWKITQIYTEKGYSGKNINRPQLQMLLEDIKHKNINVVICTRVDRLTRSLLDFYSLYQLFEKNNIAFICLDDYFDTSTPIGRMALKMLLVFAELEREQTADRTKKSMYSRALSGLWNGGQILGYDININNPGYLKVNAAEKNLVNLIFNTYLENGSYSKTCNFLNDSGYHTKSFISRRGVVYQGCKFHSQSVIKISTNKVYIGMIEVNKKNKHTTAKLLPEQLYQVVKGKHKPIITKELFESVQKKMAKNRRKIKTKLELSEKHFFLLKELLYCGLCGSLMKTTWARGHGGIYNYYKCVCFEEYLRADVFEGQIISAIRKYKYTQINNINSRIQINPGIIAKYKFTDLKQRLTSAHKIYKQNILKRIIKQIVVNDDKISVELV